ncbi:histidine phosphatase family protein [Cytobacillus depressus]|uniref:Histidine phosphatase family protein n=1 Tax=Cytobacillus depressus TaxID=1602942 RepID=A0A6L3UWU0_9BACI|nr:histidine phosphatase family protein [Cytobacillus depressus]KAB2328594.1 histidine phosphatase family protein [Cytobacillus depressus]
MLNVYVIRHGETEWNTQKRMQGRLDSSLTEKGIKDARSLGERLKDTDFVRIISSPSTRAMETAKLVSRKNPKLIETDERLMEIHLGDWQGKVEGDIQIEYPEEFHAFWNQPELYKSLDGENFFDVKKRIADFFMELVKSPPTGNVLVVTHGVVIKALYLLCRNKPIEEIWSPPFIHGTSLTIIKMDNGKMELLLEGCTDHCR